MVDAVTKEKPSFLSSMASAAGGYVKGVISGGLLGIISGAAVGAVVAIFTGNVSAAIAVGAKIGGGALGTIGGITGAASSVMETREAAQPSAEETAKLAFMQGFTVSQNIAQAQQQQNLAIENKFRERIKHQQLAAAADVRQINV